MAKNNNLTDFVTDLSDAIRAKCKTTGKINPQDFSKFVGGMPFYKKEQTIDVTADFTSPNQLDILFINGVYRKGVVYLTNENGETHLLNGSAYVALNEGEYSNTNIIETLSNTTEQINLSGFPDFSNTMYGFYFRGYSTDGKLTDGSEIVSAGWHIMVDIFYLCIGNPNGEYTPFIIDSAIGGGKV